MKIQSKKISFKTVLPHALIVIVAWFLFHGVDVLAATPTPTPTITPTTQGLQYTGSYCSGFKATLATSSANVGDVLKFGTCLIQVFLIPLLFSIAILVFVYGIVKFVGSEESAEKEGGREFMMWGIIGIAVMFSIWGIVKILGTTFGVTNIIPSLPASK